MSSSPITTKANNGTEYVRLDAIDVIVVAKRSPGWQFKVFVLLSAVLLASWIVYSQFPSSTANGGDESRLYAGGYDPFTYGRTSDEFYDWQQNNKTNSSSINTLNGTNLAFNSTKTERISADGSKYITECKLPKLDPWGKAIRPYLDPTYYINWKRNCVREYPDLTNLVNGYVVIHPEAKNNGTQCQFRCLYPHNDFELMQGEWKPINLEPDCDVLETRCQNEKIANNEFYYKYLHVQVHRKLEWQEQRKVKPESTTEKAEVIDVVKVPNIEDKRRLPDVHVFVLDSTSHTQFLRSMPKTTTWLRERMEAIAFPHLNKIGLNSRPNGYGLFLGIQAYPVENSPMGEGYEPERDLDKMGGIYLDKEPFVGFEYRAKNYRTMMAEDWGKGVFNWPRNYGFDKTPTDHYMRPFHLRTEPPYDVDKEMTTIMHGKSCMEPHHYIIQYLKDFIDAYEDEPKFSISWMSEIAHYSVNGLYRIDDEVYDFLKAYEQKLNNSFLFIMGDHGLRFGDIRQTKQGEVEDNNPAFFLALPEHLRYNKKLTQNLRDNARQLITHFDLHATMVNIAREGHNMTIHSPFDVLAPELKGPTPIGQSLLYPFNKSMPRNCATLKIPFEFCQCQFEKRKVTETEVELGRKMANAVIEHMNADLAKKKVADKCVSLSLNTEVAVEIMEFEPDRHVNVFQVNFETLPGKGSFWGYVKVSNRGQPDEHYSTISSRFPRLNEYAKQAHCIDEYSVAPYCYCADLLKDKDNTTNADKQDNPADLTAQLALSS